MHASKQTALKLNNTKYIHFIPSILRMFSVIQCPLGPQVAPLDLDDVDIPGTLAKFGHSGFRPGQEEAVTRILAGRR